MFVVSMKTTRPRVAAYAAVMGLLAVVMFVLAGRQDALRTQAVASGGDDARRVAYLQGLGYEVEPKWTQVREVLIPAEFDETFSAYNALQQEAGGDLSPYRGQRVKCWTYTVLNYPGVETVQANLYEYKERIIGGDISSTVLGGFSHGLLPLTVGQSPSGTTTSEGTQITQSTQGEMNGETG